MNFISKILGYITPRVVEIAGIGLTVAGAICVHAPLLYVILALVGVYVADRLRPVLFGSLKNFANPNTWPGYVALGLASVLAAHHGGLGALVVAGALMTGVGRLFNQLY